jgi:uncharacterized protein YdaU (DUF1376 family)
MSQAPYMPVFTDALLGDTLHLSAEEFGAYCLILFATWSNGGQALADDDVLLARVCRVSGQKWVSLRKKIVGFFDTKDGVWRQKRLEKEWNYVQQRSETNRKNGRNGGLATAAAGRKSASDRCSDRVSEKLAPKPIPKKKEEDSPPPPPHPAQPTGRSPHGERDEEGEFEEFWKAYPRRVNRVRAHAAFVLARKTASFEQLIAAARRYAAENVGKRMQHVARPENWLGDQRWFDDPENATAGEHPTGFAFQSPDHWRHRMRIWFDEEHGGPTRKNWPKAWGPPPGEPGCDVPHEVIAEFHREPGK